MLWIETKTPEEAKYLQERMWGLVSKKTVTGVEFCVRGDGLYENGEFWADAIRKLRDNPTERLNLAKRHLPLPGAFSEAAISLRAIIRQHRNQKINYNTVLEELYRLAAIWSFCVPYASRLHQPGINVFARVPYSEFESMSLNWDTLGCDKLELLTKTDRGWMCEAWGQPHTHTTAHEKCRELWDYYENILVEEKTASVANRDLLRCS